MKRKNSTNLQEKVKDIIKNARIYHKNFYNNSPFTGPSLYFHRRAIGLGSSDLNAINRNELIYATLVSWGMHRMGPKGAKMVGFEEFSQSLEEIQDSISKISKLSIEDMVLPNSKGWELAETIYKGINIMNSNVSLVGNSKVMTHLISHLFAPIDRRYTLEFLYGSKSITGINEYQWELFKKIHLEFFYPILQNTEIKNLINDWMNKNEFRSKWDTYPLKIVDNLVIGVTVIFVK